MVHHGTNPSASPSIFAEGLARGPGAGQHSMQQVLGINVLGVYTSDKLERAMRRPMTFGQGPP
eukprot:13306707-Alexandrium_andersonii.AAC.1